MADFRASLSRLYAAEGLYDNDERDSGGETFRGISRNNWPKWPGWALVDAAKKRPGFPATLRTDIKLERLVEDFYRNTFWTVGYAGLPTQELADKMFLAAVNSNPAAATRCLQRALRACGRRVVEDGRIGTETLTAAGAVKSECLLAALRSEIAGRYRTIAAVDESKQWALNGWLNRAYL